MKISIKKLAVFIWICGLLLAMAGCLDKLEEYIDIGEDNEGKTEGYKDAIAKRVYSFGEAVEKYDVDGMLAFLDGNSFKLIIAEGGHEDVKDFELLKKELIEDEEKQLHWRDPVPEGHGYDLTLELSNLKYNKLSATGARLIVEFRVWERADEPYLSLRMTDEGSIVYEMVSLRGEWLCREMTINFRPVPYGQEVHPAAQKGKSSRRGNRRAFCFGRLDLEE